MKFSIVTVCYNEEKNISATIESVLNQTYGDFEYIVCDGMSKDKTLEIAESYRAKFEERNINYTIHSEKDGGIYFGMNNGIDLATGDYVIFINAGDLLYSSDVMQDISQQMAFFDQKYDIIYGNTLCIERGFAYLHIGKHEILDKGMSICHQAILISTELIKNNKFNTKYRIIADYEMVLKLKLQERSFKKVDINIATYKIGGVSTTNTNQIKEYFSVWDENGIEYNKFKVSTQFWKNRIAYSIKMKMPEKVWFWWCKRKNKSFVRDL